MTYRFFFVALLLMIAACGNGGQHDNELQIPLPRVIISDYTQTLYDIPAPPPEEFIPPEPDIPSFNEYTVFLDFEPETRIIRGIKSVRYTNRTNTNLNELVFIVPLNAWSGGHPAPYSTDSYNRIFRHGRDYGFMDVLHVTQDSEGLNYSLDGTILTIGLPRVLGPYETAQIHIQFEASIPMIAHRTGANEHAIWAGAFLPVEAIFDRQGWHRPVYYPTGNPFILDVANYTVEITTPIDYIVAGTGVKTETYLDERKITSFTAQMTRDFAFAISPYFNRTSVMTDSGAVEIVLYHYTANLPTDHILNVASETFAFFEETVGVYPYTQLSIVETDMFLGGENFSGIIFMDSDYLRTYPGLSNLRRKIGRQWFSIIIGSNPIEESWLNGGMTYFLQYGLLDRPSELRAFIEREHNNLSAGPASDYYNEDHQRIASRLNQYDLWIDYVRIQHQKAGIMFYALYREMGPENFKFLLREYFRQFAFHIATASDFIALAEEIHGSSLRSFFDYWLYTTELPDLPNTR